MTPTRRAHPELLKMANQIALFFESQTPDDPDEAARALAGHLHLFWAPAMRIALVDQFAHGVPDGARSLVAATVHAHGADLRRPGAQPAGPGATEALRVGGDAG